MSDDKYLTLLEELNQYDYELEQLSQFFCNGFNQLSRANYYNKDSMFSGKYGSMYYDMDYEGQLYVEVDDKDKTVNILKKKLTHVVESKTKEEDNLKQRGLKDSNEKNKSFTIKEEESNKKKGPYDPIKMFAGGFSVPMTLRQCQTSFQSSIPLMQDLINHRNELLKLIKELEESKNNKSETVL